MISQTTPHLYLDLSNTFPYRLRTIASWYAPRLVRRHRNPSSSTRWWPDVKELTLRRLTCPGRPSGMPSHLRPTGSFTDRHTYWVTLTLVKRKANEVASSHAHVPGSIRVLLGENYSLSDTLHQAIVDTLLGCYEKELGSRYVTLQVHSGKSLLYFFLDWVSQSPLFLSNISKPFLGSILTTISRLLLREGLVSFISREAHHWLVPWTPARKLWHSHDRSQVGM